METLLFGIALTGLIALAREATTALAVSKILKDSKDEPDEKKVLRHTQSTLFKLFLNPLVVETYAVEKLIRLGLFSTAIDMCSVGFHALCSVARSGARAVAIDHEEWPHLCGISMLSREGAVTSFDVHPSSLQELFEHFKPEVTVFYNARSAPRELVDLVISKGTKLVSLLDLAVLTLPGEPSYSLSRLSTLLSIPYDEAPSSRANALLLSSLKLIGVLSSLGSCKEVSKSIRELNGVENLCEQFSEAPYKLADPALPEGIDVFLTPRRINSCSPRVWTSRKLSPSFDYVLELPGGVKAFFRSAIARGACSEREVFNSLSVLSGFNERLTLLEKLMKHTEAALPFAVYCKDVIDLVKALETQNRKLNVVFVESAHSCASLAGLELEELLSSLWRVSKRLWISVADVKNVPHYAEVLTTSVEPIYVIKGAENLSLLDMSRVFGFVLSLADSNACVFATTSASRLMSFSLGLRTVEKLEDVFECSKVIVPTTEDLKKLSTDLKVSLRQTVLALAEASRGPLIVVSGWSELSQGLSFKELSVEPEDIGKPKGLFVFENQHRALDTVEKIAKEKWGLELRPYQKRIALYMLEPYVRGYSYEKPAVIALLPTGAGKSLIFQSVALALHKATGRPALVVSPLIALIEDQITALEKAGVKACRLDGYVTPAERLECLAKAVAGEVEIVYATPEQVEKKETRRLIEKGLVSYIILDEVHCAIRWGYTFRPAYANALSFIRKARAEKRWLPIATFTATLSEGELKKLAQELDISEFEIVEGREVFVEPISLSGKPKVVRSAVTRRNLRLEAIKVPSSKKLEALLEVIAELRDWADKHSGGPWIGVVFVPYVKPSREEESAEEIARRIKETLKEETLVYHGQMSKRERSEALELIRSVVKGERKSPRIIVATKAFGMGVDIPYIRWVVHYMMSESIEDYYQEVGRGGRDGKEARCVLIHSGRSEFRKRLSMVWRQQPRFRVVESLWKTLVEVSEELRSERLAFRVSELMGELEKRFEVRISEEELEKSLHVLSLAGLADYEIVTGVALEKEEGYVIARGFGKRVYVSEDFESSGEFDRYCFVEIKRRKEWKDVLLSTVRALRYESLAKLIAAFRLAELLVREGETRARDVVVEYFEIGGSSFEEKVVEEMIREALRLAVARGVYVKKEGQRRVLVEALVKSPSPALIARALAYGILVALLDSRTSPADVVVYTEKGMAQRLSRSFKKVIEEFENRGYVYPNTIKVRTLRQEADIKVEPGRTAIIALYEEGLGLNRVVENSLQVVLRLKLRSPRRRRLKR
ncbi:MAG: helicase-related protein [Acidilobaceae archaeon]